MQPRRAPVPTVITIAALLFLFVPLAIVVLFSFNSTGSLTFPFAGFSSRWYRQIIESAAFRDAVTNSAFVGGVVALSTLVLGTLAAYGLTRASTRLRTPIAVLLFLPLTLPGLFLGLSLLVLFSRVEVNLSLGTVMIAHMVWSLWFGVAPVSTCVRCRSPATEPVSRKYAVAFSPVFTSMVATSADFDALIGKCWPGISAAAASPLNATILTFFCGPTSGATRSM